VTGDEASTPGPMRGVRVLEVAQWLFVPAGSAILADWGADVIKVEHPEVGDPMRNLRTGDTKSMGIGGRSFMFEIANRGKRSIGVDLRTDEGREIMYELAKVSDVFMTSYLRGTRRRLGIDVDQIREVNPDIVYVRGSGYGAKGPDSERGAFDSAASWARGGFGFVQRVSEDDEPLNQRSAGGDAIGAMTIAGGVAAALFRRATTGKGSVVDISLLGSTMWVLSPDIVGSKLFNLPRLPMGNRDLPGNPLVNLYGTADGRYIQLAMPQSDLYWADLVTKLGHPELAEHPDFKDSGLRTKNREACTRRLKEIFGSESLSTWLERMADVKGVWSHLQSPLELHDDVQVIANGYINYLPVESGQSLPMVTAPVQFDEHRPDLQELAPGHAVHTDEVLQQVLELDMDRLLELKIAGTIT
jgi:crotonobetainyl-CoA:carnitine CoA-transferase CaiB-like acyl-CoA transferase